MQHEAPEILLVQGLRAGDDAAIQQFFSFSYRVVYPHIRARCVCEEDAEDVLSMVVQKVLRSIDMYDPQRGSFKSWVFCVASSTRVDYYRKEFQARSALPLPAEEILVTKDEPMGEGLAGEEEGPASDPEWACAVRRVLAKMQPRDREVLELWAAEVPREEMANQLGVTRQHLRVIINRAKRRFSALAEKEESLRPLLAGAGVCVAKPG
ncbi:MAG: sigma-70 family RNA polymerase sigma factor [Armatimonadota bacterium]|nr:sigma-70 family RNA polymerase sigma factor [Armatimonadota bacterium]